MRLPQGTVLSPLLFRINKTGTDSNISKISNLPACSYFLTSAVTPYRKIQRRNTASSAHNSANTHRVYLVRLFSYPFVTLCLPLFVCLQYCLPSSFGILKMYVEHLFLCFYRKRIQWFSYGKFLQYLYANGFLFYFYHIQKQSKKKSVIEL